LIIPTAPGGVGIFEACFLFFYWQKYSTKHNSHLLNLF